MANITEFLNKILSARYGRDVRQSIHDSIKAINDEVFDYGAVASEAAEQAQASADEAQATAESIEADREQIAASTANISTNAKNIATNTKNIATNTSDIATNKDGIATNKNDIAELTTKANVLAPGIVNSASGEVISLADSSGQPFVGLSIYGNAEQGSTTGAQLFDKDSITIEANSINISGADYTDTAMVKTKQYIPIEDITSLSFSCDILVFRVLFYSAKDSASFISASTYNSDGASGVNTGTVTVPEGAKYIRMTFRRGDSDVSTVIQTVEDTLMLNAGDTSLPYEPYTGRIASPNPDYPQDIEIAGASGSIVVDVLGKNLTNVADWTAGGIAEDGSESTNNDFAKDTVYRKVKPNTYYVFSVSKDATIVRICQYDKNKAFISREEVGSGVRQIKVLTTENTEFIRCTFYINSFAVVDSEYLNTLELQLEEGETATTYEPYTKQSITISTPNGLPAVGDVADEIDYERGVYIQRVKKVVFDGVGEYWSLSTSLSNDTTNVFITSNLNTAFGCSVADYGTNYLCDRILPNSTSSASTSIGSYVYNNDFRIRVPISLASTADEFKAWLSENPMTCLFPLATPIETDISEEEMAAYKELHTNYPNTTILNDAGVEMGAEYVADTKIYIDNKFNELAVALLTTGSEE